MPRRPRRRPSSWFELLTGPRPAIRTVEVLPPSLGDEVAWVCISATFVCLCVIYVFAFQVYRPPGRLGGDQAAANGLLPFQVLFRDLPGLEQREFRAMKEGMDEALRLRGTSGAWPAVDALAAMEIPPFAPDVLDKSPLVWTQRRDGLVVDYLGVPAPGTGTPAFLILVQEPEPTGGEQPSPAVVDEEHQLLPGGTLLHVTYWKHAPGSLPGGLVTQPALAGWVQIRVTDPLQSLEKP